MSSVSNNLFGTFVHKLDPKNRVAIPAEWRPEEGGTLVLIPGARKKFKTVKAYTQEKFEELVAQISTTPGFTPAQIDDMTGMLTAKAGQVTINAQGKLLIPRTFCDHAKLVSTVTLVARRGYFEIWNLELLQQVTAQERSDIDAVNQLFGIF